MEIKCPECGYPVVVELGESINCPNCNKLFDMSIISSEGILKPRKKAKERLVN